MVTHSPTHRLHEALDSLAGKVAQINTDAAEHVSARQAARAADGPDSVTDEMTTEGGR